MGKYDAILAANNYPKVLEEPGRQAKIDAMKTEILDGPADEEGPITQEEALEVMEGVKDTMLKLVTRLQKMSQGKRQGRILMHVWRTLRQVKDLYEVGEKELNLVLDAYAQLLIDQYENEGTSTIKDIHGNGARTEAAPYASVIDKDAVRKWAMKNGFERELQMHHQTLNAIMKRLLLEGQPTPDGIKIGTHTKVVIING